jgi:ribose-phosphate pyrophosphokinase
MNTINLIYPTQSDIQYTAMIFPDGQPHIKIDVESAEKLNKKEPLQIVSRIANANDLLLLLFVKNTLDYMEFEQVSLNVSYLLAARMDRVMMDGEPFSLKVIAAILNQRNFKKIRIFDPHSEVATALIERSYTTTNHLYVKDCLTDYFTKNEQAAFCLVSPDGGALKKIHKLAQQLNIEDVVECMKERDVKTGQLTNFKVFSNNLQGKTCFIIDDICDGGGTFIGTAAALKNLGAKKIVLVVSHGIFSRGNTLKNVDEIYTTDSYKEFTTVTENFTVFPVGKYLTVKN